MNKDAHDSGQGPAQSVAEAEDGQPVRLSGRVRLARHAEPLISPIGERPCVYYQVRELIGVESVQELTEAQDFYLEDATGRALVEVDRQRCQVEAAADRVHETMQVLDADIEEISRRLSRLKELMRGGNPAEQRKAHPAQQRLRKLATLLCSTRAHARGRIHGGRRTREQQAQLIRELSETFKDAEDVKWAGSLQLDAPRHEVLLVEGAEVTVEGIGRLEPDPDPAAAVHYREVPLRLVVRAPSGGPLRITDTRTDPVPGPRPRKRRRPQPSAGASSGRGWWWWTLGAGALAALLYWLFGPS